MRRTLFRKPFDVTPPWGLIELRHSLRPLLRNFGQKYFVKLKDVRVVVELLAFDRSIDVLSGLKKVKDLLDIPIQLQNPDLNDLFT